MAKKEIYANGRTIVHAGDGLAHVCAPPDVCKTPTPGGPQPTPYVNVGKSSALSKGTKSVKIAGNSVAIVGANLRTSSGNEPGSVGGLVSGKVKGKAGWQAGSPNVRFEGKSVVRFLDACLFNGNTYNSSFKLMGGTGWAYGDDQPCILCSKSTEAHRLLETDSLAGKTKSFHAELMELYEPQRTLVNRTLRLIADYDVARRKHHNNLTNLQASKKAAGSRAAQIALAKQIKEIRAVGSPEMLQITTELRVIDTQLAPQHVLRAASTAGVSAYIKGYMLGIVRCKCNREFVASSSDSTPGFRQAAAKSGATLCSPISPTKLRGAAGELPASSLQKIAKVASDRLNVRSLDAWVCAAAKAIQGCYDAGHCPASMSEVWFGPTGETVSVKDVDVDGKPVTVTAKSGQTTPSCRKCRVLLPALLCDIENGTCG